MQATPLRWAIVVIALTFSVWNYIDYKQEALSYIPSAHSGPIDLLAPPSAADTLFAEEGQKMRLRHVEWEVLILGLGAAAWLLVGSVRHRS